MRIEEERILGLTGPIGAAKATALNAIPGLTLYQGELKVLGRDPVDRARSFHARCLLDCRCRRGAVLDADFVGLA